MKISVGILAYNEANTIAETLRCLSQQSLFTHRPEDLEAIEIVCLPNGCTDGTAGVARRELRAFAARSTGATVNWRVCELGEGSKTNAWNVFVHHQSMADADYLMLLDADVQLPNRDCLLSLVKSLEETPAAHIAAGTPIKDIALGRHKTIFDRLSLAVSSVSSHARSTFVCGMLYCGRTSFLRRIELPRGMQGEDAFLMTMAVTSLWTEDRDIRRITHPREAKVVFAAYRNLGTICRQRKRRMIARYIESLLYDYFESHRAEGDAGMILEQRNRANPEWVKEMLACRIERHQPWIIPAKVLTLRFRQLASFGFAARLLRFPVVLLEFPLRVAAYVFANRALRAGNLDDLWKNVRGFTPDSAASSDASGSRA